MAVLEGMTTVLIVLAVVVLLAAAVVTMIRLSKGPSSLDRIIASDTMVGIVIAGLAIEAAIHDHGSTFPVMVVLSLVGFAGATGMARFVGDRDVDPTAQRDELKEKGEKG